MALSSFFDYPTSDDDSAVNELELLPGWTESEWETLVSYTQKRHFSPGEIVIRKGDTDRSLFIIVSGRLEVVLPGARRERLLPREAGTVVGEQAFVDGRPRSADVRGATDGEFLALSLESFESMAAREPALARDLLLDLARILSVKLRQSNAFIAQYVR